MPYIDRQVIDHKERELHRLCYRMINDGNEKSVLSLFNGEHTDGMADFDLNTYLAEHIPVTHVTADEQMTDRVEAMLGTMSETDRRVLHLMDYYEKQS